MDAPVLLAAVHADLLGFVRCQDRVIIDEVQRASELLMALKLAIDQDRRSGRFLLIGSANLMALPTVADSLAGHMEIHALLPLSNAEIAGRPADFLDRLLRCDWPSAAQPKSTAPAPVDSIDRVLAGGYPEMRLRSTVARRQVWVRAYLATLQQVGGQIGLDGKTVEKYIGNLEKLFMVRRLQAWSGN